MARELDITINIDDVVAKGKLRDVEAGLNNVSNAVVRLGGQTVRLKDLPDAIQKQVVAAGGLVDAYGRAIQRTEQLGAAQANASKKTDELASKTENLAKKKDAATQAGDKYIAMVQRYVSAAVIGSAIVKTFDYAASLEKLAFATAAGIQGAQNFENIAVSTNVAVTALATGTNELARRLADGEKSAAAAMRQLGIDTQAFQQLRADQQFISVAAALGRVSDQGTKLALAKDLFRNWQEVVPALRADVDELSNSVAKMSDEDVQNIARVKNAWDELLLAAQRYGAWVLNMAIPKGPSPWVQDTMGWVRNQVGNLVNPLLSGLPRSAGTGNAASFGRGMSEAERRQQEAMATVFGNPDAEAILEKLEKDRLAAIERKRAEFRAIQMQDAEGLQFPWQQRLALDRIPGLFANPLPDNILSADTIPRGQTAFDFARFMRDQVPELSRSRQIGNGMGFGPTPIGSTVPQPGFFSGMLNPQMLSQNIMGAIMGGGQVSGAVGGTITGSLTTRLMSTAVGKGIGGMLGGTLGSIIPGVGTILGSVLGNAIGKLFAPSEESSRVSPNRDRFFEDQGGLAAFNAKLGTTKFAEDIFAAKTVEQYEKAVRAATRALDEYDDKQREATEAQKEAAHDADLWAKRQQTVDAALNQYGDTVKRVDDLLKKYKFTQQEAAPIRNQLHTNLDAATLMNDWQMLIGIGVDPDVVNKRFADPFSKILESAKKTGTELPSSMQPVLQKLLELGLLTDGAGKKLEELGDVKFGKTLPESLDALTRMVQNLIDTINGVPVTFPGGQPRTPAPAPAPGSTTPSAPGDAGGKAPGGATGDVSAHTGGYIGFGGLKRYHRGGLLDDEMPFIGQVGEGILNRTAMRVIGEDGLHAMNRGILPMRFPLPQAVMPEGWEAEARDHVWGRSSPYRTMPAPERPPMADLPALPTKPYVPTRSSGLTLNLTIPISAMDGASVQRVAPQLATEVANVVSRGGAVQTRWRGSIGIPSHRPSMRGRRMR